MLLLQTNMISHFFQIEKKAYEPDFYKKLGFFRSRIYFSHLLSTRKNAGIRDEKTKMARSRNSPFKGKKNSIAIESNDAAM